MRSCDTCHECCVHVAVVSFDKPKGVPCTKLTDQLSCGCCSIYKYRPSECMAYACAWLDGYLTEDLKPEHSGILLELAKIKWPKVLTILMGFEIRPGALEKHKEQLAASAVDGVLIGVISDGKTNLFGSLEDRLAYSQFLQYCRTQGSVSYVGGDGVMETYNA